MKSTLTLLISFLIILNFSMQASAQDENNDEDSTISYKGARGFHIGFYMGAFFPNKNSTIIYDGYGYDVNGNRNEFSNSFMYRRIVTENDPNNGGTDRIATELGVVNHEDWSFDETDMPTNLKYSTAFLFGLALNYGLDQKQSIIANLNFAKLRVTGNFTIETRSSTNPQLGDKNYQFALVGSEQRMMFQLGYSRILGDNEKGNFFIEAGLCVNNAKVEKNFVQINNLELDLTSFDQNVVGGSSVYVGHYTGWGFGAFAGVGLNLTMNPKYTIQFLYTPSYETINLGQDPVTAIQHSIGLRAYYNF
ncbi:hypothetical protein BH11BAC1_BH11BAC1_10910 [soil metagenome]